MHKLFKIISKHRIIMLILLFFILISACIFPMYKRASGNYIVAKFSESGPLYKKMPVYFKGYQIGQVRKINLSKDYKYTLVKIALFPNPKEIKLPDNITAKVKNHNVRKEYIDLLSPDDPSGALLARGDVIRGEAAFDLESFLSDIADSGLIVPLIQTFTDTLNSFEATSTEIKGFFTDSRSVVKENKPDIKQTTNQLAKMSKSLNDVSSTLNRSITEDKVKNTTSNVDKASNNILSASENVKKITASVDCATRTLDQTVGKIDCAISETTAVASNLKTITGGLKETLAKRFAGIRLIFGKPIKGDNCPKRHSCRCQH